MLMVSSMKKKGQPVSLARIFNSIFIVLNSRYCKYGVPSKELDFAQDCACPEWNTLVTC